MNRVGLIGAGKQMKKYLLPTLLQVPNVKIVGISSSRGSNARIIASEFGAEKCFQSIEEMIDTEHVTHVVAAVDPWIHPAVAEQCLENGIRCFIEKPPCVGADELRRLRELEQKHGDSVIVGMNFRYSQMVEIFKSIISAEGPAIFGKVTIKSDVRTSRARLYSNQIEELVYELGIHALDLANYLFGSTTLQDLRISEFQSASKVRCFLTSESRNEVEVEIVRAPGGFKISIDADLESGMRVELEDLSRLRIENESWTSAIDSRVGLTGSIHYEWPIRKSSSLRCGYLPLLALFFGSPTQLRHLEQLETTYNTLDLIMRGRRDG